MADKRAEAMWQLVVEGKSITEVADIFSLSVKRVRAILHSAGKKMRDLKENKNGSNESSSSESVDRVGDAGYSAAS